MLTKLLSTSIIAGVFLVGCGGEIKEQANEQSLQDVSMPHHVEISPKNLRDSDPKSEEYLNYMKTYNLDSRIYHVTSSGNENVRIKLRDYAHRNQDLKYVFYRDRDYNINTGYVNPWVPNVGADILIEDGIKYKYTGTPGSNEWSWEVIDWDCGDVQDEEGIQLDYTFGNYYGITLNQDWTYNSFLGYLSPSSSTKPFEKKILYSVNENREFTVAHTDRDIYLHAYKKDNQKLDDNEANFTYEVQVDGKIYYVEGNNLFDKDKKVIADNLQYEIRDYDAIIVIPKILLNIPPIYKKNDYKLYNIFKINKAIIRDNNWNRLDYAWR